jgi:hypothetical protein
MCLTSQVGIGHGITPIADIHAAQQLFWDSAGP